MIYLISKQQSLFPSFKSLSVKESIELFQDDYRLQVDSETTGLTPQGKICDLLCFQIGNDTDQIVIDTSTVDIRLYKELLESKLLVLANAKFDLMFLYNYNIHPLRIFDVMIAEQVIHLGWPARLIGLPEDYVIQYMSLISSTPNWDFLDDKAKKNILNHHIPEVNDYINNHCGCSLKALCYRYLHQDMDKSVRGEIIYLGLIDEVITYAANDVVPLNKIMDLQIKRMQQLGIINYGKIEMDFVPVCAYGEWCGLYLNTRRWKIKMYHNKKHYDEALKKLDGWFISEAEKNPKLKELILIGKKKKPVRLFSQTLQLDLFQDINTSTRRNFEWSQSDYVTAIAKILGFDVTVLDKKKDEEKDSVEEDVLKSQKGINDEFLKYYFEWKGWDKEISGYGQNYLDDINPNTGRIHPTWKQIGTISGRMTNSSEKQNDLMKIKKLGRTIKSVNVQVLPKTFMCRDSFTPQDPYKYTVVSCDYAAAEARLGAIIYNDKMMLETFEKGWDSHSVAAKLCFPEELKDIDIKDIKKKRNDLRNKAKAPEFACQFGGSPLSIAEQLGVTIEEAEKIYNNYMSGYVGMKNFQKKNGDIALRTGYVPCTEKTGGKVFWWDWCFWKKEQQEFSKDGFWDKYRLIKKSNPKDPLISRVRMHMKAKSKWSQRMSLNAPTQHSGAEIFKYAMTLLYYWIIENNLFNEVKICAFIHDECFVEYPLNRPEVPSIIEKIMQEAAYYFYTTLPIPAEASPGGHWIH